MAHPDLDDLLSAMLPFAQDMLAKQGEFFPFGGCMKADGQIELLSAHPGDENASSQEAIDMLAAELIARAQAGEIRAGGVCYDVTLTPDGGGEDRDAICTSLDHVEDDPVDVFQLYRAHPAREPEYQELTASPGTIPLFLTDRGQSSR